MTNIKRLLSVAVAVAMLISMLSGISFASAADEVDLFEALKYRSIYAVANMDGYTESNLMIRDQGREHDGGTIGFARLVDISSVGYDSETKTLTDDAALQSVISTIRTAVPERTEEQIKNVIIFAKINGKQYITDTFDGPFNVVKKTDVHGTTEKAAWFNTSFARHRTGSGRDETYLAQCLNPYGPYFAAQSDVLADTPEITFVVEYLDEGTSGITLKYAKVGGSTNATSISRTNSGKWKTAALSVTDANISSTNTATGFIHDNDDIRFESSAAVISRLLVCKTADYEAVLAGEELPVDPDFITDWYQYAVDNGGVYIEAANGAAGTGINAVNQQTTNGDKTNFTNWLLDLSDADEKATAMTNATLKANLEKDAFKNIGYASLLSGDSSWRFKEGTSANGVKKQAFFSTNHVSARADNNPEGHIYFDLTDKITQADKDVTFFVEYLDVGTSALGGIYINNTFVDKSGAAKTSPFSIPRTNTNTWKTAVIHVTDANVGYDITKTALADGYAALRFNCARTDTYISKFAIVKTPVVEEEEEPLPEIPLGDGVIDDGVDWFAVAKQKGVYIEAANGGIGTGITARCAEVDGTNTQLLDLKVDEDLATAKTDATLATHITQTGLKYASLHNSDGAWMYKEFKDVGVQTKKAFFTTKYVTTRTDHMKTPGGSVYFRVNSENITSTDNDLYLVIEFLDKGTTGFGVQYATTKLNNDNKLYGKTITVPRKDTNYWRTAVYRITDANFDGGVANTLYADGKHQLRIDSNGVDTYITKVGVVKASDIDAAQPIQYYAPDAQGAAPTIWIAGDSTVETLDAAAFPREGWGMEIANFFKQKSYTSTTGVDATTGAATNVNDGVVVINRAKGGKSTRTFLNQHDPTVSDTYYDTRWDDIKNNAKKGDYLFVNFGHNDTNNRVSVMTHPFVASDLEDGTSHRANMYEFMRVAKEKGLNLVFLTATHNLTFSGTTVAPDGVENHREAMRQFGIQYGIPVIDIEAYHIDLLNELGPEGAKQFYCQGTTTEWPGLASGISLSDKTHISQAGARQVCKFIVQDIEKQATAGVPSMVELEKWIDDTEDMSRMTKPESQSGSVSDDAVYDISDVSYTVDGVASDYYAMGEVTTTVTVKNNGDADSDATLFTAVYDVDGKMTDISMSQTKAVAAGESVTLTTDAVTVPELDGAKLRRFVWNSKLNPYSDEGDPKYIINADGYNRRAVITWETSTDTTGYSYEVYRDNKLIGTTTKGVFIDEQVLRGTHQYQVNVYKDGVLEYQTGYGLATVTSMYDVANDSAAIYAKANIDAYGNEADIIKNIKIDKANNLYAPSEAKAHFDYLTDDQITYAAAKGRFITNGSDGPVNVVKAKDNNGVEKEAWFTTGITRCSNATEKADRDSYMYFQILNKAITPSDSNVTIFVEYLSNQNYITLDYMNADKSSTSQVQVNSTPGKWATARFILNDAYFDQTDTNFFVGKSDIRFASGGKPIYISSIVVTKGTPAEQNTVLAKLNNKEFYQAVLKGKTNKYPNGVSVDFTTGEAVENGLRSFMVTEGNSDALAAIEKDTDGKYYATTKHTDTVGDGTGDLKQTYLYFDVDDDYMYGAADNKFIIEVEYQAPYEMDINMMVPGYDKNTGAATANNVRTLAGVPKSGDGEWLTLTQVVDGALLVSADNGGCDFRLFTPAYQGEVDRQLKVKKVTIKNAEHMDARVSVVSQQQGYTTIHIAADSIAAYYTENQRNDPTQLGIMGWGMTIGDYLKRVNINNKATSGASTATFGNMGSILGAIQEGDYVLISFGHNDQMSNKLVKVEDYKANLTSWINQIRAKRGVPVLVTMIPQLDKSNNTLKQSASFDERRAAVAQVADAEDVMLVKLGEQMFADEDANMFTGQEYFNMYCGESAGTHLAEAGCRYVSQIIVNSLKTQSARFATFVK